MTEHIVSTLQGLATPEVSDALDRHGIPGQCFGIAPLDGSFRLAGPAFTLRYCPVGVDGGTVGDFIDDVEPGTVVVIDNAGRLDATVWGDLLTSTAHRNGVGGTVIDGVCRDSGRSLELGYPIFSRGSWMRTGKDRVRLEAVGEPVAIGGVQVRAGDLLLGDADGVVVVPRDRAEEILETATGITEAEARIRAAIEAGASLREARAEVGYHALQQRSAGASDEQGAG